MNQAQSPPEWDLLLSAAQKNDAGRIRDMVAAGVDPSHSNAVGQSALHIASLWGNVEAVEGLLKAGANVNARNRIMGSTPLHMAAQSNKASVERMTQTIDLLLHAGANLQETDSNGAIPLAYASREEIRQLLQPQKPALYQAIEQADEQRVVSLLTSSGDASDLNRAQFDSKTPLEWTLDKIIAGIEEDQDVSIMASIAQLLFQHGSQSKQETTYYLLVALDQVYKATSSTAESSSYPDILKQLVLASLARQKEGPALWNDACLLAHQAARRGQLAMLQFMMEQVGMEPNLGNRQGMTVLHFAARSGQVRIVEYLLKLTNQQGERRIDVTIRDSLGQTALDAARVNHKDEVVALLESHATDRI